MAHMTRGVVPRLAAVLLLTGIVGSVMMPSEAATRRTTKRTTTRPRATTRPPTTRTTTRATTVAPTIPAPTTAASGTAAPTTAAATIAPAATLANAAILFDRNLYALTVSGGGSATVPLWLTIPSGFRDTITLRTRGEGAETRVRFDPNPSRNYSIATVQNFSGSGQLPLITIEAVATGDPNRVLASAVLSVFVAGGSSVPNNVNIAGPDGVSFAVYQPPASAVRGGEAISAAIDITRSGNFNGAVEFSVASALPVGMIVSFEQNTTSGARNYVFVRAASTTPAGTFDLIITAKSSLRSDQLAVRVTVV
jgi:hypothetical protein